MYHLDFEAKLKEALDRHLTKTDGNTPPNLAESIRYTVLAPGKRIRPRLLMASAEMVGLSPHQVLPAALALEMIHSFTLIHDDLPCMDDDDFRRGMPSNHKKFGEGIALLAGDALMPLALEVFLDCSVSTEFLMSGMKRLLWAFGPRGVIGGQAAEGLLHQDSNLEQLRQMHQQKTGALFSAALLIPKDFAGIHDHSPEGQTLIAFAYELGLAFQVADDLEDSQEDLKESQSNQGRPTSILNFVDPKIAAQMTVENLETSFEALAQCWDHKAESLRIIAEEVKTKIRSALEGSLP